MKQVNYTVHAYIAIFSLASIITAPTLKHISSIPHLSSSHGGLHLSSIGINGIIQSYFVEFTLVNSTEAWSQYTTQDQHLLIDNLKPNTMYAYRVAAYTVGRGPFQKYL
jgi:hypothetical protein